MSDSLGPITVAVPAPTLTFPRQPTVTAANAPMPGVDWIQEIRPEVAIHTFASENGKTEQRFLLGNGVRRWTVRCVLNQSRQNALLQFWRDVQGPNLPFYFHVPTEDNSAFELHTCRFESQEISFEQTGPASSVCALVVAGVPTTTPTYSLSYTVTRFPGSSLAAALLDQEQTILPLIHIYIPGATAYHLCLSDRRCRIDTQEYLPRLVDWDGISQGMNSEADDARFVFGNADRAMTQLVNACRLENSRIEFSLFHVGTGTKIDLWAGEIDNWEEDEGPNFIVTASDGLHDLTLPYPFQTITRTCWKPYGVLQYGCTGGTGLDTSHFPNASGSSCDHSFDGPNGCLAHQNGVQFGAHFNEAVACYTHIENGKPDLFRPLTSLVNESAYGQALPQVWHDDDGQPIKALPVPCKIISARDEDQFLAALGIVGEGPIDAFTTPQVVTTYGQTGAAVPQYVGPTLDGQPHHGFRQNADGTEASGSNNSLGLRTVAGADPAGSTDFFSLDQSGNQVGRDPNTPAWKQQYAGSSTFGRIWAAGTAFQMVRRTDAKGIQLVNVTDHQMVARVSRGLKGWTWAGGARAARACTTNPIWVWVNSLLRGRGLREADSDAQKELFDCAAAEAAAAICDLMVDPIIGVDSEKQFRFKGVIDGQQPLRQWLSDILQSCLGYYTFAFGKLRVGIRENSGAVEAFTVYNIIQGSLRLAPLKPAFNYLTVEFPDDNYDYAKNSVEVGDEDDALRRGGGLGPKYLRSRLTVLGCTNKSQAARICATRLREELGGLGADQMKARLASWRTTILALNTEPGMIVSMTHPDMPDGFMGSSPTAHYGEFRVTSWRLNKDYSIDIAGRTTTDSMYDLTYGPKPSDAVSAPGKTEKLREFAPPAGLAFSPAMYEYGTFTLDQCALAVGGATCNGLNITLIVVDELRADVFVTIDDGVNGTSDPVTVEVTTNPDRVTPAEEFDFAVGDWLLFNDTGHYEVGWLSGKTGNTWTINRHWPGAPETDAVFASKIAAHASGTQLFKAEARTFMFDAASGGFGDGKFPKRFDLAIPACCVLAIVANARNAYGYGDWVVLNTALATVPGMRTLTGGNYTFTRTGNLYAFPDANVSIGKMVPFKQSLRCAFASLNLAPTGASGVFHLRRSRDAGENWETLQTLTIAAGEHYSYAAESPPSSRRTPYSGSWPFPVLYPEDLLNYSIEQAGSTITGADLTLEVLT